MKTKLEMFQLSILSIGFALFFAVFVWEIFAACDGDARCGVTTASSYPCKETKWTAYWEIKNGQEVKKYKCMSNEISGNCNKKDAEAACTCRCVPPGLNDNYFEEGANCYCRF